MPPPPGPTPPAVPAAYPVRYDVEYPDRELNRLTSFFRFFTTIPIWIVIATVSASSAGGASNQTRYAIGAGGLLFAGPLLMILFRKKYPRWWFDWNVELARFQARVGTYFALMSDVYPATDEHQYVRLEIDYPDVERDLGRGMPIVKWLLAIPHYIVLIFLYIAAAVCIIGAWFAVVFTGRSPCGLFDFLVGVGLWHWRVVGYPFLLVTDAYPPFRLDP